MSVIIDRSTCPEFADLLQSLLDIHKRDLVMISQLEKEVSRLRNRNLAEVKEGEGISVDDVVGDGKSSTKTIPQRTEQTAASEPNVGNFSQSPQQIAKHRAPEKKLANMVNRDRTKSGLSDILSSKDQPQRDHTILSRIVKGDTFDICFCGAILINAFAMALEVQYTSWDVGKRLNYTHFERPAHEICPWCSGAFVWMTWFFGILFLIELVLRMAVLRLQWFVEAWNYLDFTVVFFWVLSISNIYSNLGFNPQVIRLLRLVRLLRLLRIVRKIQGFDALFLMTTAIKGSVSTLFWAFLLLVMCQLAIALLLNQYLHQAYFSLDSAPREDKLEVFEYFGTFDRAFFTMFELTLANWPPACRVLAEYVSPWFFLFGIVFKFSLGFAVIGVVNAVFMQETFRVASMDDTLMVRQKVRASRGHRKKMEDLMYEANRRSGLQGSISKNEWMELVQDQDIKTWLSSMDLRMEDAENLFHMIDVSRDGNISFDELEKGVARLRGAAKNLDVMIITEELRQMKQCLRRLNVQYLDHTMPL